MKDLTVGNLRHQSAWCEPTRRVVVVVENPEALGQIKLELVSFYPDTTDENDQWNGSTFKIRVKAVKLS